ncbi:MAG: hypothetical protein R6V72_11065, partial [Cyclobacterium sp.]|uniref:hypothetical protein n=1 Tax=Cyclobacterium sp. TaxID=1966343 RepID=UPI0039706069
SSLEPGQEVAIIYEIKYIGRGIEDQISQVNVSGEGVDDQASEIPLKLECFNQNCSCKGDFNCQFNKFLICYNFGPSDIRDGLPQICQDLGDLPNASGQLKINNWINKLDTSGESIDNIFTGFSYQVNGKWKIHCAKVVTGDGHEICIFDKVLNTGNPEKNGTFCTPIGRSINARDITKEDSEFVIRYLKFCLCETDNLEDFIGPTGPTGLRG